MAKDTFPNNPVEPDRKNGSGHSLQGAAKVIKIKRRNIFGFMFGILLTRVFWNMCDFHYNQTEHNGLNEQICQMYGIISSITSTWIRECLPPVETPFLQQVSNTTVVFADHLLEFNIPASSEVQEQRPTSHFFRDFFKEMRDHSRHLPESVGDSFSRPEQIVAYFNALGNKAYDTGRAIEKTHNNGLWAFKDLFDELANIKNNIESNQILSFQNGTYFIRRVEKVLDIMTRLKNSFDELKESIQDVERVYSGKEQNLPAGIKDVMSYIEEIRGEAKKTFNMALIDRDLTKLKRVIDGVTKAIDEVLGVLANLSGSRNALIAYIREFKEMMQRRRIIIIFEDVDKLNNTVNKLEQAKKKWDTKDKPADEIY